MRCNGMTLMRGCLREMNMEIQTFQVTPFWVNCYLVKEGTDALIIDPGDVSPALMRALPGITVHAIVNTHGHCDHCGGNGALAAKTAAPLFLHHADLDLLREIVSQGSMFGLPVTASPDPDRFLKDGETVQLGALSFQVLHVPGHSPGHIALLMDKALFCGDVLFEGSIGRTDLWGGNSSQLLESIRTKLLTLPDEVVVYPGHGPATTIGNERQQNPFLVNL